MSLKNKMISILKSIKSDGGMTEELYKRFYPTGAGSPKFYGLPKIHKPGDATETHSVQHWDCHLPNIQGGGQDLKAPGGEVTTSCEEYPRFYR